MTDSHPIPARLNLVIAMIQMIVLLGLLWLSASAEGWLLLAVALGYGLVMNSAYAMLHEAEHGLLHPDRGVNDLTGVVLALFFPAPFHLIRQGHIGHHMRNRSDDEAFDFYFDGESRVWKYLQLYGILTGLFWLVIVFSNVLAAVAPKVLRPSSAKFDRPTVALMESLNPRWMPLVKIEAITAILLHGGLVWFWQIPVMHWFATLAGFGVMWSAMQYVHHFGTERDVMNGALNLRTWSWLDTLWLNHNWHLRHHRHPTVPWVHLPIIEEGPGAKRGHVMPAYLRMWRGPRLTNERIENRHAGKIIR
jgi:fatty acid desaturase